MRLAVKSTNKYEWHKWFAWYPVLVEDEDTGARMWIWLETVERIYRDGLWDEDIFFRLPR